MTRPARIWATADGRYVGDGHVDAAILAAGPADPTPDDFDPATFESGPGTPEPESEPEPEPESEPESEPEPEPEPTGKRPRKS